MRKISYAILDGISIFPTSITTKAIVPALKKGSTKTVFICRLPPRSDESLSSWRLRNGLANGFFDFPRPSVKTRQYDFDSFPHIDEAGWLAENFGISTNILFAHTLDFVCSKISKDPNLKCRKRWVLSNCGESIRGVRGPVVCPQCLDEEEGYYRLSWRYSFTTYCHRHRRLLIDQCPACLNKLWPCFCLRKTIGRQLEIDRCRQCGEPLNQNTPFLEQKIEKIDTWKWVTENKPPSALSFIKDTSDLFDLLWCICHLLVRKQSFKIWGAIPAIPALPSNQQLLEPLSFFEAVKVEARHYVFNVAAWLIEDWPSRFVKTCQTARISRSTILPSEFYAPTLLREVVETHLTLSKRNKIKIDDIDSAIRTVSLECDNVSKKRVRQILGVSESREINGILGQRRMATQREMLIICGAFEKNIKYAEESRDQKSTLIRDYLIFILSVLLGQRIESVCILTRKKTIRLVNQYIACRSADATKKALSFRASKLIKEHDRRWSDRSKSDHGLWIVGRFGEPLEGHCVRSRISKMMQENLSKDLWASADAFIHLLKGKYTYGRRNRPEKFSLV